MTVLVTGGAGYIGSHMVWALLDAGEDVVVVDRLSTGFDWAVAPEAKLVCADVSDTGAIAELIQAHGIEAIVHFAGSISVPESMADPLGYYQNNTANSLALIRTAIENGVGKFVFSSTAAVYGRTEGNQPIAEATPTLPQSPYGLSKLMTETMLADAAAAHDFRYAALRYFNVSGADPMGRTGQSTRGAINLIKVATEAAMGKRDGIEIFGTDYPTRDGTCVRDFIHVTDLVAAHLDALSYLRAGGDSLIANCGYGRGYTVREVLDSVRRISGRDFDIRLGPRRDGDIVTSVADSTRARTVLGWRPQHDDIDKIVSSALAWEAALLRSNHAGLQSEGEQSARTVLDWSPPHDALDEDSRNAGVPQAALARR
ncbi:UDP-glucose-4-epimerase GalE [Hoeflea sp. IMCC20628]|uniref:UDP-glucose 4-epimerase GalE n=1 Tax=Hoeflea sp. IMCC20628 TaxID=1620421 RepID=UPI00063BE8E4|nr:UDP-glucose 4-epimerase GalE [Hoeflea sp. IMCC20628]AKI02293.1 UDP-glucose-4-epimerase GalE [Hoeflea sp. IMCC20628]